MDFTTSWWLLKLANAVLSMKFLKREKTHRKGKISKKNKMLDEGMALQGRDEKQEMNEILVRDKEEL